MSLDSAVLSPKTAKFSRCNVAEGCTQQCSQQNGANGGGLAVDNLMYTFITNSVLDGNIASACGRTGQGASGGALSASTSQPRVPGHVFVEDSVFTHTNAAGAAKSGGDGGAISLQDVSMSAMRSHFLSNVAQSPAGAILGAHGGAVILKRTNYASMPPPSVFTGSHFLFQHCGGIYRQLCTWWRR